MKPKYYLTKVAGNDLQKIVEYTLAEWGEEQVIIYRDRLISRLETLAQFPEIGRKNIHLCEHIFYVVEGKHYVFYKIVDDGIEILRFIHTKSNVLQNIEEYL